MKDLIEALSILLKYGSPDYPTHCEHDVLYICNIDPLSISVEDIKSLDALGFIIDKESEEIYSYKYGSC